MTSAGRTLYQGHLFVHDRLLSESGMQNHPLTPMTDPDLRLIRAGAHPRLCIVRRTRTDRSDRLSDHIRAEDILALKKFFQLSAADGGQRVAVAVLVAVPGAGRMERPGLDE